MSQFFSTIGALVFVVTSLLPMASLATKYVAQVRLYVDQSGENQWKKATGKSGHDDFKLEMQSTFFEVNELYKSMNDHGVEVQFQLADIIYIGSDIIRTSGGKVVSQQALDQFEKWVSPKYSSSKYDLALLYTGANLVNQDWSDGTYGFAYVGTVCSVKALGVVELHGSYSDALVTAHEMGHIFGSEHDGSSQSPSCSSTSGEIMNPIEGTKSPKHFFFSTCSAALIEERLKKLNTDNNNCLKTWSSSQDLTGPRYASLSTPDGFCKRQFGQGSYIARYAYKSYTDEVCVQLACMTSTVGRSFQWTYEPTPPGLKCGKNKQCIQGKCIKTSGGSSRVSDFCPFGDQPKIEGSYQMSCSRMTADTCRNWKNTCCGKCGPGSADDVCKHYLGKDSAMARLYYGEQGRYGDLLCSNLACLSDTKDKTFYWNFFTAPDGMQCGQSKRCQSGKCLSDRALGDPEMSDNCPFGDQPWLGGAWQKTCTDQTNQYGCNLKSWKDTCCASCGDPGTADEICQQRYGKTAYLARNQYDGYYGDNLCSAMSCITSIQGTQFSWSTREAPDNMKCGKGKRCQSGKCVTTGTGDNNMSDSCPWGDIPFLGGSFQKTCKQLAQGGNNCRQSFWRAMCCTSC